MHVKIDWSLAADERSEIFHDGFDCDMDAAVTLAALVRSAGDFLGRIIGRDKADIGMAAMLTPLVSGDPATWREDLEGNESFCFSQWPLGARLHDLAAYAHFGIVLGIGNPESPSEMAHRLEMMVADARQFLAESPLELWHCDHHAPQLREVVTLACNRWALDNGDPIEPAALAAFGGVTEAHIRNLMAGSNSRLPSKDGAIPALHALSWLADREGFLDSVWREPQIPSAPQTNERLSEPLFVPVARDDSIFHPGLRRGRGFTVGPKGAERQISDFSEALSELHRMPVPYWRRPNEKGKWGIVRGTRWDRYEWKGLALTSDHSSKSSEDSDRGMRVDSSRE